MPPTTNECCDWCYGPLTEADLASPLGKALGSAEAAACARCVARRDVLRPPDSLHPADVELTGPEAWHLAVAAFLAPEHETRSASRSVLRRVAGYDH